MKSFSSFTDGQLQSTEEGLQPFGGTHLGIIFPKLLDFGKWGDIPGMRPSYCPFNASSWSLVSSTVSVLSIPTNQIPGADVGTGLKRAFLVCSAVPHLFACLLTVPVDCGDFC